MVNRIVYSVMVQEVLMVWRSIVLYSTRPPPSTHEDPGTGQDLLGSKDLEK